MRKLYTDKEIQNQALEAINAFYDEDGILEHNDPELFNEDVFIEGELVVNGERVGSKVIHTGAPSEKTTSELKINKDVFSEGTYTIDITDGNNDLDFTGIIQVADRTDAGLELRGFATNYDSLAGEIIICHLKYESNKIIIQFYTTDGSSKSFDPDYDYYITLIKIA